MEKTKESVPRGKIIAISLIMILGAALIFSAALWGAPSISAVTLWDNRAQNPAPLTTYSSEQYQLGYTVNGYRMDITTIVTSDEHLILSPSEKQAQKLVEFAGESGGRVLIKMDQNSITGLSGGGLSQTFRVGDVSWYTKSSIQILLYTDYTSMEITDQMISQFASYERNIDFTTSKEREFNVYHDGKSVWTDGLVSMRIGIPLNPGKQTLALTTVTENEDGKKPAVEISDTSEGWSYAVITSPGQYVPEIESDFAPTGEEEVVECVVTARSLNVRSGPGTSYGKIGSVKNGETVGVIAMEGNWAQIVLDEGTGWVSIKYIEMAMG